MFMKKHITSLLVITVFFICIIVFVIGEQFWSILSSLFFDASINEIVIERYFQKGIPNNHSFPAYIFITLKIILSLYFLMLVIKAFAFLKKMHSGKLIFKDQNNQIRFVGSGLIAYASIKYAFLVFFGIVFYKQPGVLVEGLSHLFSFYIIGKLLLLASSISSQAESYKTENDLTV